ncbi:putative glutathion S-transferase II, GST-II [Xylogone sp. PMI_703]|nr:putative glutathion S-transferase II, GST-II [Xylogone sp. PMI_703]
MAVKIIGVPVSACTRRPLLVLAEKGVTDFTLDPAPWAQGETKKAPYTDAQPFAVIPLLENEKGFKLAESRAIAKYLATVYHDQGTKLVPDPTDLEGLARFDQWASIESSNFDTFVGPLVTEVFFGPIFQKKPTNTVIADDLREKLGPKLDVYDRILSKQKYMAGDEFSLIDIYYMPYTDLLYKAGEGKLIDDRPNLKAWWERVSSRESWMKVSAG